MQTMDAMVLEGIRDLTKTDAPLVCRRVRVPDPGASEILIRVTACGVCHTELDEIEGRTPPPVFPVILGHQAVGRVAGAGPGATRFAQGDRVGVAWIHHACGDCRYCRQGRENLCPRFRATGRDVNGGYAHYLTVTEDFAYPIPDRFSDVQAAPLLCAGAIGYRSLALGELRAGQRLGLTGFGASGHLVLKMVRHQFPRMPVAVFARSTGEQEFARSLGASWTGHTSDTPPQLLDCIIDTTPAWTPVVAALKHLSPGGRLVINAIRKEKGDQDALQHLAYESHLWHEKQIKSVANVTRNDVTQFLQLAAHIPIVAEVQTYALADANRALMELKNRRIRGAKVLVMDAPLAGSTPDQRGW